MHVLVLASEFPPHVLGGLGVVAHRQVRRLAALPGVTVTVVARGARRRPRWQAGTGGWRVLWLPPRRPYWRGERVGGRAAWRLLRRHGAHRPDVALVHHPDLLPLARRARAAGIPVVYACHSLVAEELRGRTSPRRRRQEELLRLADCVVVGSEPARQALCRLYPDVAPRVRVVPPGVDPPAAGTDGPRRPGRLLYVGRLSPVKGIGVLLRAVARAARRYPAVRLDVAGRAIHPRRGRQVRSLIRRLGLGRRVRLLGWLDRRRLAAAYRQAAAVVVPSLSETFGLVACEALAHGAPLIATDAGALAAIPSDVAYKVSAGDAVALARAIVHVLTHPDEAAARAAAGREWVRRFRWDESVRQLAAILRTVAAGGAPRPAAPARAREGTAAP